MSMIIASLKEENEMLMKQNRQLIEERDFALTKSLINEQISEAA